MTASTQMNLQSVLALQQQSLFGKHDPVFRMILSSVLAGAVLAFQIVMTVITGKSNSLGWTVCLVVSAVFALLLYMALLLPRLMYKNMGNMKDAWNTYTFLEDKMQIETRSGEAYHATAELAYSAILRVAETSQYFFIYTTAQSAFVIDKSRIEGGSYEELRELLIGRPQTHYIACRY